MTTVTIQDSTYKRLRERANARKLSIEAYLDEVAGQDAPQLSDSARQLAALESFTAGMTAWTTIHLPPRHVVDDSRESIYEGRGE